jgi:hypothetical protein
MMRNLLLSPILKFNSSTMHSGSTYIARHTSTVGIGTSNARIGLALYCFSIPFLVDRLRLGRHAWLIKLMNNENVPSSLYSTIVIVVKLKQTRV